MTSNKWTPEDRAAFVAKLDAYERDILEPAEARQKQINRLWDRLSIQLPAKGQRNG